MWQTANFNSGVGSFGDQILPAATNQVAIGNVFFVGNLATVPSGSVAGVDDPSYGMSSNRPFKTINYAITKCTANNGDIIYVLPLHTETIKAAGGITCGTAGISILGMGFGSSRPAITLSTATTATFLVTAANVFVQNIYFDSTGIDAIVTAFDVRAAGFVMDNCEHYFAKTSYVTLAGMTVDTAAHANNLTIMNCYIHGDAVANCTNWLQLVGGDSIKIMNDVITGNFTTTLGGINNITAALTNVLIDNNRIMNNTAVSTVAICLLTGSKGWVTNNRLGILNGTAPITGDAVYVGGNYYKAAVGVAAATLL